MKRIAIVGSTGSIGQAALDVVNAHRDRLRVVAMAAGENAAAFVDQVGTFAPDRIALATATALEHALHEMRRRGIIPPPHAGSGPDALVAVATHPDADLVLFASSGTTALDAALAAIEAGKAIALANKEILVMAGALIMDAARRRGVAVLPVDSEHNAIHQCLCGRSSGELRRLILTASGGPFRERTASELERVTPHDALRHPTWRMGPKITIDSATLMNKGLEVIEARWLFEVAARQITVLVHPQSIVHSMVELVDGSVIAQLGVTDMRLPIQYAFSYPERWAAPVPSLDLAACGRLEFDTPDTARFPSLALAFRALDGDSGLPIVLNAANEIAVCAFLEQRISLPAIPAIIEQSMDAYEREAQRAVTNLQDVRGIDTWAREFAAGRAREVQSRI
jgi:1-deoxy-D-xylulose-5-phosphate reductoisomerase